MRVFLAFELLQNYGIVPDLEQNTERMPFRGLPCYFWEILLLASDVS